MNQSIQIQIPSAGGSKEPASGDQFPLSNQQYIKRIYSGAAMGILAAMLGLAPAISHSAGPEERGQGMSRSAGWAKGRVLVMPRAGLPEKELRRLLDPSLLAKGGIHGRE